MFIKIFIISDQEKKTNLSVPVVQRSKVRFRTSHPVQQLEWYKTRPFALHW